MLPTCASEPWLLWQRALCNMTAQAPVCRCCQLTCVTQAAWVSFEGASFLKVNGCDECYEHEHACSGGRSWSHGLLGSISAVQLWVLSNEWQQNRGSFPPWCICPAWLQFAYHQKSLLCMFSAWSASSRIFSCVGCRSSAHSCSKGGFQVYAR
jgi:hypothetical protein